MKHEATCNPLDFGWRRWKFFWDCFRPIFHIFAFESEQCVSFFDEFLRRSRSFAETQKKQKKWGLKNHMAGWWCDLFAASLHSMVPQHFTRRFRIKMENQKEGGKRSFAQQIAGALMAALEASIKSFEFRTDPQEKKSFALGKIIVRPKMCPNLISATVSL